MGAGFNFVRPLINNAQINATMACPEEDHVDLTTVHTLSTYHLRQALTTRGDFERFFPNGNEGVCYDTLLEAMVTVLREDAEAVDKERDLKLEDEDQRRRKELLAKKEARKRDAVLRSEARMAAKQAQEAN